MAAAAHRATTVVLDMLRREKQLLRAEDDRSWEHPTRRKSEYLHGEKPPNGRANLERFERALAYLFNECGIQLGYLQHKFLSAARTILLPRMYGNSIVSEMATLRARYAIKRLYRAASIIFPRRSGKTTVQTILGAVIAVSQSDGNVVSKAWLNQCIKWMELFQGSPEFRYVELQRDLRETVQIRNCTGTTARIASFPGGSTGGSGTHGTRGMGERLFLMMIDEYLFINPALYPTILPLLQNGAGLMITSSMSASADDEVKRMIHAKMRDGREVVMRLDWIRACADCTAAGRGNGCKHIRQRPQHFQRSVDQEVVKALMTPFGDEHFDRELLNIGGRSHISPAFERVWIEPLRMRANDYVNTLGVDHRAFFVCIDPAGQGFSQNVILSATVVDDPVSRQQLFVVRASSSTLDGAFLTPGGGRRRRLAARGRPGAARGTGGQGATNGA